MMGNENIIVFVFIPISPKVFCPNQRLRVVCCNNHHQPIQCAIFRVRISTIVNRDRKKNWIGELKLYEIPVAGFSHSVNWRKKNVVDFFYSDDIRLIFDNNWHTVSLMSNRKNDYTWTVHTRAKWAYELCYPEYIREHDWNIKWKQIQKKINENHTQNINILIVSNFKCGFW